MNILKSTIISFVKNLISLTLTQETGNTISESVFKFKNKHKWIYNLIYGTVSDDDIINNILQRFNKKFDILMIHSSFNGMIPMYRGDLSKLLSMLLMYCKQNDVTLVMPTFFLGTNNEAKEYYKNEQHIFDVRKNVSQMGMLSELFRRTPEVKRSIHPTHSICAIGPFAELLIRNHHLAETTFGEETPFYEMIKYDTLILGIGTRSDRSLTQIHAVEDIMKDKFPIPLYSGFLPVTCLDEFGNALVYNLRIKNPDYMIDSKSFRKILKRTRVMDWNYKGIPFFLTQARVVTETFIEAAREGSTMYKNKNHS